MDNTELRKSIPHDKEAEEAVIGSMLLDTNTISKAMDVLKPEDFYNRAYSAIYEAMTRLYSAGKAVDTVILQSELKKMELPPEISSLEYIMDVISNVPTSANIMYYAEIVKNKSTLRNLLKISENISGRCYQDSEDPENILEDAEKQIFKLAQYGSLKENESIENIMVEVMSRANAAAQSQGSVTGVPSGFKDLDYMTAGFQKSDLILLAARPSMGKTAFALNIVQNVAVKRKIPVVIFSLEMSNIQIGNRLVSMESRVDSKKIRIGKLNDSEWANFLGGARTLAQSPIIIDDTPGISPVQLRSKCRKYKIDNPELGMIVIDYLQLMSSNRKSDSRQQEISEISRSLKELARELDVPVIALSQLSRAVEKREDKHPMLSDLRESGAIEQDADVVMFLYRDDYYNKNSESKNITEVIIAKQRNGPTGNIDLVWLSDYTKYVDMARVPGSEIN